MNKYGLALASPIQQTILPAMTQDGLVIGWYPIAAQTFAGTETSLTLPDTGGGGTGTVVPLLSVTTDSGNGIPQYMAAVWPKGLAFNYFPWASTLLQKPDEGYFNMWSMPTEGWVQRFGLGAYLNGMVYKKLNPSVGAATNPGAPSVSNGAISWQASIAFAQLTGDCEFFDFNWVTLFAASSTTKTPLRIVVTANPTFSAPFTVPPLVASVIGLPQATANGVLYDSIRIMKLRELDPGTFTFTFAIYDSLNQTTTATLTLTVQ